MPTGRSILSHGRPLSCRSFHGESPERSTVDPHAHVPLPFLRESPAQNALRSSVPASLCARRPDGSGKKRGRRLTPAPSGASGFRFSVQGVAHRDKRRVPPGQGRLVLAVSVVIKALAVLHAAFAFLVGLLQQAGQTTRRATRSEIKILSTVDVAQLQKDTDRMAQRLRLLDNKLQQTNWSTELS